MDDPNENQYRYEKLLQRVTVPTEKRHIRLKYRMTISRKCDNGTCRVKGGLVYWWDQELMKMRYELHKKVNDLFIKICELTLQNRSKPIDPVIFTGFQSAYIIYSFQLFWEPGENITIGITRFDEDGLNRKYYHVCSTPLDLDKH